MNPEYVYWTIAILLFRYALGPWFFYSLFYVWKKNYFKKFKVQPAEPKPTQVRAEIKWTLLSSPVDALILLWMYFEVKNGISQVYFDFSKLGLAYFVLSFVALALLHDAHFYFSHRLLHWKPLMRTIHHVHHIPRNPTPWSSFCFHPVEKFIGLSFFPLVILILPVHPFALISFAFFSSFTNMMGHSGFEFGLANHVRHPFKKFLGTSTQHNMHHEHFDCHYSLYFDIWDKLLGTEHPGYAESFDKTLKRRGQSL